MENMVLKIGVKKCYCKLLSMYCIWPNSSRTN